MKTGVVLLLGVGGLVAWTWIQKGISGGTVQVLFKDFAIRSLTDFQITLMVQNVGNASIDINSMTGTLSLNGNFVGNVSTFQHLSVPGSSQAPVVVDFTPSFLALPSAISDLIKNGGGGLNVKIDGNLNYDGIIIPFTVKNN